MPERFIVGQLKKAETGCVVMERKMIGEVEVYAEIVPAANAEQAAQIANALNAQHEAEIRAEEAPAEVARVLPLYAGGPHSIGVQVGEIDVPAAVQKVYDDGNPGLAFALAEANGYDFRPEVQHNLADFGCEARDDMKHAGMSGQRCPVCRPVEESGEVS